MDLSRQRIDPEAVRARSRYPVSEPTVSREDRFDMILKHAHTFERFHDAPRFPRMRKHLGWYCSGFPHAAALRAHMVKTNNAQDVERLLHEYVSDTSHLKSKPLPPHRRNTPHPSRTRVHHPGFHLSAP